MWNGVEPARSIGSDTQEINFLKNLHEIETLLKKFLNLGK